MKLKIGSQKFNFEPNFSPASSNWKRRLSWYTPSPVLIGTYNCFVKRFENQPSGWPLIKTLLNEENINIPKVLAVSEAKETGDSTWYLFHEFLKGPTLKEALRKDIKIQYENLIDGLWKGLEAIHKRGYWHTDFNEDNILFSLSDKQFYLIDIDSTESVKLKPRRESSKKGGVVNHELAIIALRFIEQYIDKSIDSFAPFGGILLNQLQFLALIAKLDFLRNTKDKISKKEIRTSVPKHLKQSGTIADQYLTAIWDNRNDGAILSLPILKTIVKHHFPNLH